MSAMIILNTKLIANLNKVVRVTHDELSGKTGLSIATWYRIYKNPGIITVPQLLALANGLHIPVRRFFSTRDLLFVGKREDYVVEPYAPCYYDGEAAAASIGRNTNITKRAASATIGVHWVRVTDALRGTRRLTVAQLLRFCHTYKLNIFDFIIDPNARKNKGGGRDNPALDVELQDLRQGFAQLREDYSRLKAAYDEVAARLDKQKPQLLQHSASEPSFADIAAPNLPIAAEPADESATPSC